MVQKVLLSNDNYMIDLLYKEAVALLHYLIATPSFSKQEADTAAIIASYLEKKGVTIQTVGHNIIAKSAVWDTNKPVLLLNSHHDTVKPALGYTKDPFTPIVEDGKLYGLGSNDAGGCLVSLIATFLYYYQQPELCAYNLVLIASAEEEISGQNGIALALQHLDVNVDCAIVGEPTLLQMAVAERGLMVIDGTVKGVAGHAARNEGENAIYNALADINWFKTYQFEKSSALLGPVSMNLTSIHTENKAHNVVPDEVNYIVDIRINEQYTHQEVLDIIQAEVSGEVKVRSMRLKSSMIPLEHPLVQKGIAMQKSYYGSPTLSDKALMPFPALKMGPGDSARSHTADEYIYLSEIEQGIKDYITIIHV